jgi:hypothetical protein
METRPAVAGFVEELMLAMKQEAQETGNETKNGRHAGLGGRIVPLRSGV